MKKNNITIHDIAHQLNVSASTISRALNDNPRISEPTRKKIKDLAKDLGYFPNNLAAHLRKGHSQTAGVIVPRINRVFFSNVIGGIEEVLTPAGYTITICQSHELFEKEFLNMNTLNNLRVDGIIMSLSADTIDMHHIQEWLNRGRKIVMFDRISEELDVPTVKINDFQGAYLAVNHLIEQGYTKIAHFSGPEHLNVYRYRKEGYIAALRYHGLYVDNNFIIDNCLTREKGTEACSKLLSSNNRPDAIFAASDFSAVGAMITARKMGFNIPSEIGIVGFANEPFTEFISPPLTTVDQDSQNMGKLAAKVFLNSMDALNDNLPKEKIILEPRLIIRESSLRKQSN